MTLSQGLCSTLAIAATQRLDWERHCKRERLIDEFFIVRTVAEFLQAHLPLRATPEKQHPNIPNARIDLVGQATGNATILYALEAKWIPLQGGARHWPLELFVDICRLQHLTTDTNQDTTRILVVAGIGSAVASDLVRRKMNTPAGRKPILPEILPLDEASRYTKYQVRYSEEWLRPFLLSCAQEFTKTLPSTYDALLAGHCKPRDPSSVEVFVWLLRRPKGWSSFAPRSEWPSVKSEP